MAAAVALKSDEKKKKTSYSIYYPEPKNEATCISAYITSSNPATLMGRFHT
jgi:hypothetical protein